MFNPKQPSDPKIPISVIEEDDLLLIEDDEDDDSLRYASTATQTVKTWKVIIVDDEPAVHQATKLALKNFRFEGKLLSFLSAYSATEGIDVLQSHHLDTAFILLDVVMETHDAGLRVIRYIREELHNQQIRIILRTGHPGEAPEESVLLNYDINDYKLKVELTRQRLLTTVITALRSYRDIVTIEQQRKELTQALEDLEKSQQQIQEYTYSLEIKVAERTAALERANRDLRYLADLDGLTHVANRRCFDAYLREKWDILIPAKEFLSLLLVDVDYFKHYNDHYGHLAGDECLKQIAQALNRAIQRPTDLVARYGGEEFAIILPHTPLIGAQKIAAIACQEVAGLQIPHIQSLISDYITLSIGISSLVPQPNISMETIIATADKALYQAKQQGRDRYCSFNSSLLL